MNRNKIILSVFALFAVASLGAVAVNLATLDLAECGNEIVREEISPSGEYAAVVFERTCGADGPTSTHISVLEDGEALGEGTGNAFLAKGPVSDVIGSLRWQSDSELRVELVNEEIVNSPGRQPSSVELVFTRSARPE